MKAKIGFFLLAALALGGCHSDHYYHYEAVKQARKYLLQNVTDLDTEQINFVRFNTPVLLHSKFFDSSRTDVEHVSVEMYQICVAWIIPRKDEVYMVYGASSARMNDWRPVRVLKKPYLKSKAVLPAAAGECRTYAQNNFFSRMSAEEIVRLRFTGPYLYSTNFELNFNPDGKLDAAAVAAAKAKAADRRQYSLVWKLSGRNLVFSGLAAPGFDKWSIAMAGILSDAELNPHLVRELMTPADYVKPFPKDKEPAPAAKSGQKVESK